ncbi:MAG: T9SS type A sorting domain-containing protein, partial [candidate division WOR-3 bacterium]|nr:T9SS type A sorting domain-containing protein [candidate division WOR-3 bacterium]
SIELPGIMKFSPNGNLLWLRYYPELTNFLLLGLALDIQGNIYACGMYSYQPVAVVMKCDSLGYPIWLRFYNWGTTQGFESIVTIDEEQNIIAAGYLCNIYESWLIMAKLNNNGDTIWTRQIYGGHSVAGINKVKIDHQGNIIIAGYNSAYDVVVAKYSPTGNLVGNRILNFRTIDIATGIAIDSYNNIFCSGSCGLFDSLDYFLIKFSPSGETLWTRFYEGIYDDVAMGVVADYRDNPIISGYSSNGSNYDILTIKYQGTTGLVETSTNQSKRRLKLKVLSNPVKDRCVILFNDNLSEKDSRLEIFDATGRIKKNIKLEKIPKGNYQMNIDVSDLSSGVYFIRLKQGKEQLTERLVIVK